MAHDSFPSEGPLQTRNTPAEENHSPTHERRFTGEPDRLRSPERLVRLEIDRVVGHCLEGLASPAVVDVGTGTGVFAEAFLARGCTVVGVDPNPHMLAHARRQVPEADFHEGTAEALPFLDEQFDLAFLGTVLHEADDPVAALREARRVARRRVAVLEFPYIEEDEGPRFNHRLAPEAILAMAKEAGFSAQTRLTLTRMELFLLSP